jgi:BMFP domain-containing protein YqiC
MQKQGASGQVNTSVVRKLATIRETLATLLDDVELVQREELSEQQVVLLRSVEEIESLVKNQVAEMNVEPRSANTKTISRSKKRTRSVSRQL